MFPTAASAPPILDAEDAASARRRASAAAREKRDAMNAKVEQLRKVVDSDGASPNNGCRVEELLTQAERKLGYAQEELDAMQHLSIEGKVNAIVFDSMFDDP